MSVKQPEDKARRRTSGSHVAADPAAALVLAEGGDQAPISVRAVRSPLPPPPSARGRRARRTLWVMAAATAAVAVAVAVVAIVVSKKTLTDESHEQTPAQIAAAKLRDEALPACASGRWPLCQDKLDEAAKLDPASEADARVERMREDIRLHTAPAPSAPGAR